MVALETVNNAYLGGDASLACSEQTASRVDAKVVEIVQEQHKKAYKRWPTTAASWTRLPSTCTKKRPSPARNLCGF